MSLAKLRQANTELVAKLNQPNDNKSRFEDKRIFKPFFDKDKGTGYAVIRFLPPCEAELNEVPYFVSVKSANFKYNGKFFFEKSLNSIGKPDPLQQLKKRLWDSGVESDKEEYRRLKQRTTYYANVLVIKDPAHPENEGKVMIYEYGPAIANLIKESQFPKDPEFEDEEKKAPVNPFDLENGADLIIKMVGKTITGNDGKDVFVPDYEKTKFASPTALFGGDEDKIMKVWSQCYPLKPFVSEDKFKTEAQLRKRLVEVLGTHIGSGVPVIEDTVSIEDGTINVKPSVTTTKPKAPVTKDDDDDIDDLMASILDD